MTKKEKKGHKKHGQQTMHSLEHASWQWQQAIAGGKTKVPLSCAPCERQ
jgi:hypothetical protein